MAPDGVVGVIVPSSILSNTDAVRIRTRELLLQFFDLVSIAELGSGTFGKTGTNTVVLFLRRKAQRPEPAEHYRARVDDFFEGDAEGTEYQDDYLVKAYCNRIEVPYEEYIKLFAQTNLELLAELLQYDIFQDYKQAFNQSTEIKNLRKSNLFKNKTGTEQSAELEQRLIAYLHTIEKDKLYHFILAHEQAGKVLIVNAPSTNKEQKQFLGYEWSGAKGSEGIKYNGGETLNDIITPLFDPNALDNSQKINTAIKCNFIGETADLLPEYCHYAVLTDMLDFTRIDFDKAISLNPKQNIDIESKWDPVKLGEVCNLQGGNTFKVIYQGNKDNTQIPFFKVSDMNSPENTKVMTVANNYVEETVFTQQIKATLFDRDSIIFPKVGMSIHTNKKRILGRDSGIDNNIMAVSVKDKSRLKPLFLLEVFNQFIRLKDIASNANPPSISKDNLKEIKIPLPSTHIQQQIVDECDAVDQETDEARQTITDAKQTIEEKVQSVINAGYAMKKIGDVYETSSGGTPLSSKKEYYENGTIPWINSGEVSKKEINFADNFITELGLNNSSAKLFPRGTVLLAMYGATAGKVALLNIKASTNQALCALLPAKEIVPKFLVLVLESMYQDLLNMRTGMARDNLSQEKIKNIRIPVSPLNVQQQLVVEVEQLEAEITQAQAVIDNATERKNAILTKYL